MEIIIGIGEYAISNRREDIFKTFGLGSCIAVTLYSSRRKVLGLAHIPLPYANFEAGSVSVQPGRYVDTVIPLLLSKLENAYHCKKGELVVKIFGGAKSSQENDVYKIGERNIKAAKSVLSTYHINYREADTGGTFARSIEVDVATGTIKLKRIQSYPNLKEAPSY